MTKASIPTISVCIPVYNCEAYIGAAIESVLAQTWTDFELVILDNRSTDRTLEVIRSYGDPRIRVIENDSNIGAAGNWNKALAEARGEFIKIVCADDLLYPDCLERQLAQLRAPGNEAVVMVCSGRDVIDEQGKKLLARNFRGAAGRLEGHRAVREIARTGTNRIGEPTAVLFRSRVRPGAGLFVAEANYVIDVDYWCRILLQGDLWVIPQSLCAFRVSTGSWSVQTLNRQSGDYCSLIDRLTRNPAYRISRSDAAMGRLRTRINMQLRKIFYRFFLRGSAA